MGKCWRILARTNWLISGRVLGTKKPNERNATTIPSPYSGMAALAAAHQQQVRSDAPAAGRSAVAYGLRERALPEPLGMLEQKHGNFHDRRGPLHAELPLLCRQHGQAVPIGGR